MDGRLPVEEEVIKQPFPQVRDIRPKFLQDYRDPVKDLEQRALRRHQFHGEWNYRLIPAQGP